MIKSTDFFSCVLSGNAANGFIVDDGAAEALPKRKNGIRERLLSVKEIVVWPIVIALKITVPSTNSFDRVFWVPVTMVMCIFWIGCGSFVIVELITIIGKQAAFSIAKIIIENI